MTCGENKIGGFISILPKGSLLLLKPYAYKSRSFQWNSSVFTIKESLDGLAVLRF